MFVQRRDEQFNCSLLKSGGVFPIQKEKWDGIVLNVHATCTYLRGNVCSQMLGAQASTECDKVPYPFRKGKTPMLKTLKELDLPGLFGVAHNEGVSSSWSSSYRHCTGNLLQPIFSRVGETDAHRVTAGDGFQTPPPIKHAPMQMLLWTTAGQLGPPDVSVSEYVNYRTSVPVIRSPPYSGIRSVIPSQVAESPRYNGQSRPSSDNWLHIPLIQAAAGGREVTPADDHKRDDNKRKPNNCWSHTKCQRSCHIDSD